MSTAQSTSIELDFEGVDIRAIISYVAEQTGRNFIVDPRVRGDVTVVSGGPISENDLYNIFLEILQIQGFAAIEGENTTRIIPEAFAKQLGTSATPSQDGGYATRLVDVENADVTELVPLLRPLMPQNAHLAAAEGYGLIVIADSRENVERLERIIRQIDQQGGQQLRLISLNHASATDVAPLIGSALSGSAQIIPDPRTNTLVLNARANQLETITSLIAELDQPSQSGNTEVIHLNYADAESIAELLTELMGPSVNNEETAPSDGIGIRAHASTNSIVVHGSAAQLTEVRSITEALDIRQPQVLVEAVIAEVSTDYARRLGVQWAAGSEKSGVGVLNFGSAQTDLVSLSRGIYTGNLAAVDLGDGLSLAGLGDDGGRGFAVLIEALATDSANNILSTPSILTLANEEASITVGQNVPFRAGRAIEDSGQAFDTIERRDVGVQLTVTPQINEGDAVRLDIQQEVSQLAPNVQNAADLITNKRSLATSVIVNNNEAVVLGGLIDDAQTQQQARVPGLGNLPVLGALFRYDQTTTRKVNLMVFLRPTIIRSVRDQAQASSSQYTEMRAHRQATQNAAGFDGAPAGIASIDAALDALSLPPPFSAVAPPPGG
jgi:general secretion pathway protein D